MAIRTTISLPEDLKRRMDAVDESVNWSAVAASAFETRIAEIAARRQQQERNMDSVCERLRTTRVHDAGAVYQKGFHDGYVWAGNSAKWQQLDRLYVLDLRAIAATSPEYQLARTFVKAIEPNGFPAPGDEDDFWNKASHGSTPSNEYVIAFEDGARDLLARVRRRLRDQRRCPRCSAPGLVKYTSYIGVGSVGPQGPLPDPSTPSHRITCSAKCGEPDWREPFDDDFIRETD